MAGFISAHGSLSSSRPLDMRKATFLNADKDTFQFQIVCSNKLGILNRILLVFSRRGYGLKRLNFNENADPRFATVLVVLLGQEDQVAKVANELKKQIDIIKVTLTSKTKTGSPQREFPNQGEVNVL